MSPISDINAVTNTQIEADLNVARVYRRVSLRLLPLLIVSYGLAYLDRVNISFAKLQMQHDLGMTDSMYGFAAGVFFVGYVLFEVPSNLLLAKIGARKTLSRVMILWGATSAAMFFVHDTRSFYIMRFLLGVFEAGFGPGMLFYLSTWYGPKQRARVMAYVLLASPVAGIIGGPLSGWVMTAFDGRHGVSGWQWMFLVEGAPCVLLGIFMYIWLEDTPLRARWLSASDKAILANEMAYEKGDAVLESFGSVLLDLRTYLLAFGYFCMISGIYTVTFWLPTLLKSAGVRNTLSIGIWSALPYAVAVVAMIAIGAHSDRLKERRWHTVIPCAVAGVALAAAAMTLTNLAASLTALVIATSAVYAGYTIFWAIPGDYLKGTAAAGGMALINSIGLLGGFLSPMIIGYLAAATGNLQNGLLAIAGLLVCGALVLFRTVKTVKTP